MAARRARRGSRRQDNITVLPGGITREDGEIEIKTKVKAQTFVWTVSAEELANELCDYIANKLNLPSLPASATVSVDAGCGMGQGEGYLEALEFKVVIPESAL